MQSGENYHKDRPIIKYSITRDHKMDTDFIPAVCPNCGGKLQVEPNADTLTCQFCGTEHIIRRNVTGSVTLEAFARCPLCKRNDRSEKVSAILKNQTSQSEGVVPQQRVYQDSKGLTYTQTINVPVKTVQTSDLSRRLSSPLPPSAVQLKSGNINYLLVFSIIVMFIGIVLLFKSNFVWGIIFALIAIVGFFLWRSSRRKAQEKTMQQQSDINNGYQKWKQAISRWDNLYYCGRDDIIFIPGEKTSASVSDMLIYIYTDPARKGQIPLVNSSGTNAVNSSGNNAVNSSGNNIVNSSGKNTIIYNLLHKIGNFWKTGKNGKLIIIVVAIFIIICLCCVGTISFSSILPKSTSTPTPTITYTPLPTKTPTPTNTPQPTATFTDTLTPVPPATLTAQAQILAQTQTAQALVLTQTQIAYVSTVTRQAYLSQQTATAEAYMTQIASNATSTAQAKYATSVAQTAAANAVATVVAEAGVTKWLIYKGLQIGVQKIEWSYSLSYYRPENGKIFLSLYIVGVNNSTSEDSFDSSDIELVDGGGEVNGHLIIEPREPGFGSCTVKQGGKCEGWWTTQILDRPEVKQNLTLRWSPCLLFCNSMETPIIQKK
jgi:predicted RNA-binding Zn-ribbon protein involved in translation (DUF1610 family)/flagellar basal body-associated protein FliL